MPKAFFVASTGQHVGKTTVCLGLLSGLRKIKGRAGFLKPVGQESVETAEGLHVDKDVILIREHFGLQHSYEEMSPVLLPQGFTRKFLDGKVDGKELKTKIQSAFRSISGACDFTLVEGTGHVGVGSIVNLNNAQVAALLQIPIIFVAPGGLGSSFDELELNKSLCEKHGVPIAGVILNRVLADKREMVLDYMAKALSRWHIPIIGCIPYDAFLSNPSMKDFENLFRTELLSGQKHRLRHFQKTRLAATSAEVFSGLIEKNSLVIAEAGRKDIVDAVLERQQKDRADLEAGLILTGDEPPSQAVADSLVQADVPAIYAPLSGYAAMKMITSFVAKIRKEDAPKVREAVQVVESHIDFSHFES